ncbi:hypothetical protein [Edwardsiella tarda]|uniref:hypothetical protein n=1 Tax=Edwardsiella tarda TaxID=636 RepID=UPI003D2EA335
MKSYKFSMIAFLQFFSASVIGETSLPHVCSVGVNLNGGMASSAGYGSWNDGAVATATMTSYLTAVNLYSDTQTISPGALTTAYNSINNNVYVSAGIVVGWYGSSGTVVGYYPYTKIISSPIGQTLVRCTTGYAYMNCATGVNSITVTQTGGGLSSNRLGVGWVPLYSFSQSGGVTTATISIPTVNEYVDRTIRFSLYGSAIVVTLTAN